jgi:hypothetical protein
MLKIGFSWPINPVSTNGVPCIDHTSQRLTVLIPEPMIHSASSSPTPPCKDAISSVVGQRVLRGPADQIHIDRATALRTSLQQLPEIRPEVIARARILAADSTYPSDKIIRQISAVIIKAPDLSEDLA